MHSSWLLHRIEISRYLRSPTISGTGDGSFPRPPLAEFSVVARSVLSPIIPCAAVWDGGDTVAPQRARWRAGKPFQNGAF